jgi:predicted acyltransferase (DUF342 family)
VAIKFIKEEKLFLLESSSYDGRDWVRSDLEMGKDVTIKKTFIFKKEDLYEEDDEPGEFDYEESSVLLIFGKLDIEEKYYEIEGRKLVVHILINGTIQPAHFTVEMSSILYFQ